MKILINGRYTAESEFIRSMKMRVLNLNPCPKHLSFDA